MGPTSLGTYSSHSGTDSSHSGTYSSHSGTGSSPRAPEVANQQIEVGGMGRSSLLEIVGKQYGGTGVKRILGRWTLLEEWELQ